MHPLSKTLLVALSILLAACQSAAVTPTPRPSGPSQNRNWQPVVKTFNGVEMVKVPAGCFTMGSAEGRRDETPTGEVCFSQPFWLDRHEITNAQFGTPGPFPGDLRPRTNLTWAEARDYCAARGARLPSEAEWEYAARGPEGWHFPWGQYMDARRLSFDQNNNSQPADVGSYPGGASWVGALDMAGNVFEWTSSLYAPYPYNAQDGRENPDPGAGWRVYRGGWLSYIDYGVGGHTRFRARPGAQDWFIGARCAMDETRP